MVLVHEAPGLSSSLCCVPAPVTLGGKGSQPRALMCPFSQRCKWLTGLLPQPHTCNIWDQTSITYGPSRTRAPSVRAERVAGALQHPGGGHDTPPPVDRGAWGQLRDPPQPTSPWEGPPPKGNRELLPKQVESTGIARSQEEVNWEASGLR